MPSLTEPATSQGFKLMGLDTETFPVDSSQSQTLSFILRRAQHLAPQMVPTVSLAGGHQGQCRMYRPLNLAEVCKHSYKVLSGRGNCWQQLKVLGEATTRSA